MTDVTVTKNEDAHCYEAQVDGQQAGILTFRVEDDVVVLPHTKVEPRFEGQGVGSALARFALDDIRRVGGRVEPACPFVAEWIRRHPDYADLVS